MAEHELYTQLGCATQEAEYAKRTASQEAAFLLPHLRAGMHVLDAGCGPGSITLGLAAAVALGEVVGIDMQLSLVEQARALAVQRGVTNARFEVANVYDLPFPDGSFDAAFANRVLEHLREPVRALAELRRVLRPGGIAGVHDVDMGGLLLTPETPLLQQWFSLLDRVRQHNGANCYKAGISADSCWRPGSYGLRLVRLFGVGGRWRRPASSPSTSRLRFQASLGQRWQRDGSTRRP